MTYRWLSVAALLLTTPALAQQAAPAAAVDWHSYALLLEQQRDRESQRANNFEVEIGVMKAHEAELSKWWADYVTGLEPSAPVPPAKDSGK